MTEIININTSDKGVAAQSTDITSVTEALVLDARNTEISKTTSLSVPIAELSTLGAGVSSLIPAFNTVTQTVTMNTQGLYQLANASVGDTLKIAKNGRHLKLLRVDLNLHS